MEGFVAIDTLYLHMKYPKRDIYDMYHQPVEGVDTRILKTGFVYGDFVIKGGGSGYKVSVWQHDARVFLTDQVDEKCGEGEGMGIWIQLGPKFLIHNMNDLKSEIIYFLIDIGIKDFFPISVTRLDLAIDCLGLAMVNQNENFWKNGWVGRSQLSKVIYNSRSSNLESIYIGSRQSPIYLRIYDKVAQSIADGDYLYWLDVWKNFEGPVTRIEWEVKPKKGNFPERLTDFDKFNYEAVRELLVYLLDWGKLCNPDLADSNRSRWEENQLWLEIRELAEKWLNGVNWPTSRFGKEFHGVNEKYIKFLSGTISGGMAKINPDEPTLIGLLHGLEDAGESPDKIQRKAKMKAELVKRL